MITAEKLQTYSPSKFFPGYASIKRNGIHAIFDPGLKKIYTRTPAEFKGLSHLNCLLEGEYPWVGEVLIPGMDFETMSGKLRSFEETPEAEVHLFNIIIPEKEFSVRRIYMLQMYDYLRLYENPKVFIEPMHWVSSHHAFEAFFKKSVSEGEEGVCLISGKHIYQPGKRTASWLKWVPVKSIEVTVVEVRAGNPGTKYARTLGRFICQMDNGKVIRVGIFKGKNDFWRDEIWADRKNVVG